MLRIKLAIADCDRTFTAQLEHYLQYHAEFDLVGIAEDGLQALSLVQRKHPDILLTDMLLPQLDGISLLMEIGKLRHPPLTICLSDFYSHACVENARRCGASYYAFKPMDPQAVMNILREYAALMDEEKKAADLRRETDDAKEQMVAIHRIVSNMGFSPKYTGTAYLVELVALAFEAPMHLRNLSKDLYQILARKKNVSPASIERSVRTAIRAADRDGHIRLLFGESPTNKHCIQRIINELKSRR